MIEQKMNRPRSQTDKVAFLSAQIIFSFQVAGRLHRSDLAAALRGLLSSYTIESHIMCLKGDMEVQFSWFPASIKGYEQADKLAKKAPTAK